jgi:hypothetical protein
MSQLSRAIDSPNCARNGRRGDSLLGRSDRREPARSKTRASAARATETFALTLMGRLPKGNLAFSPDSVAASLAMVGTGAAGQTATQIAQTLYLSSPTSFAAVAAPSVGDQVTVLGGTPAEVRASPHRDRVTDDGHRTYGVRALSARPAGLAPFLTGCTNSWTPIVVPSPLI